MKNKFIEVLRTQTSKRMNEFLEKYQEEPDKIPLSGLQDILLVELLYELKQLNKKLNDHNIETYECDICGKTFDSKESLASHVGHHKRKEG